MRLRRASVLVLAATVSAGLAVSSAQARPTESSTSTPPRAVTAGDPLVRVTGELLRTAVERPGDRQWFAVRTKDRVVPVSGTELTAIAPRSTVTVDVAVPDTIADAAAGDRTVAVPVGADTVRHDLSPSDLDAASDSTPAGADSAIGQATTDVPLGPGVGPLRVAEVVTTKVAAATYTPATRKITFMEVTPRGAVRSPITQTAATQQVAGTDSYWRDNSRSTLKIGVPTIKAHYASPYSCADNPFALWNDAADRVGWLPVANASLVLGLPQDAYARGCSWGLGTVGANPNDWGLAYTSTRNVQPLAHEIGHNMSLGHADVLGCTGRSDATLSTSTGTWSNGCEEVPYGDYLDVMGPDVNRPASMLSSPQAVRTGMLESAATTTVGVGTKQVTLKPLGGRTGVRAAIVTNAVNGVVYYVEYRTAAGRDTGVIDANYQTAGVKVLRYNAYELSSVLLDPTPTGNRDATMALAPGKTLTSHDGKITVTTVSATSSQAVVRIANNATPKPFANKTKPAITGTRGVGKRLTATKGTWSPTPTTYTYRWKRNGATISGASKQTYTPTKADAGRYLTVTVTPRRTGYTSSGVTSSRVGIPIYATTRPYLSGTAKPGRTLTAMVGAWTPKPSSYAYQWYRNGAKISGATKKTYTVKSSDRGKKIQAKVTARRTGYSTGSMLTYSKVIPR